MSAVTPLEWFAAADTTFDRNTEGKTPKIKWLFELKYDMVWLLSVLYGA